MLHLVVAGMRANWRRTAMLAVGVASAYAAMLFSYVMAGSVQVASSAALRYIVADASVWIAGPGSARIDPGARALVQATPLAPDLAARLLASHAGALTPIAVSTTSVRGVPLVVYWDGRRSADHGVAISPGLATRFGDDSAPVPVLGTAPRAAQVLRELPGLSAVRPFEQRPANTTITWLVGQIGDRGEVQRIAEAEGLSVADDLRPRDGVRNGTVFLLRSSLSRFDPFSFQTKYSALQLNATTSSIFGWIARLVFGLGGVFVVSSLLVSIDERRPEIAALAVLGYEPEYTLMLLIELAITFGVAVPTGALVAAMLGAAVLPASDLSASLWPALGLSVFFAVVLLVVSVLLMGQAVARRTEVDLVRGGS